MARPTLPMGEWSGWAAALLVFTWIAITPNQSFATHPDCGDGIVQCPDETCDDGNTTAGDGCNQWCRTEYGFVCPTGATAGTPPTPVHEWLLDEGSGTTAVDSVGGTNGSYQQGVLLGTQGPGLLETAAHFDGVNDYVEIGDAPGIFGPQGSISFWFKADTISTGSTGIGLFSKDHSGHGEGGHFSVYLAKSTLTFRMQHTVPGLVGDGGACTLDSECMGNLCADLKPSAAPDGVPDTCTGASHYVRKTGITAGTWRHVVATFGPAGMRMYVDGALAGSDAYTGGTDSSAGGAGNKEPIALGASTIGSAAGTVAPLQGFFDGQLAGVQLYDFQLTGAEASTLYGTQACEGTGGPCTQSTPLTCGDGNLDPGEQCDDNNVLADDGCGPTCFIEFCGDSIVNGTETCDDGGRRSLDGCSELCQTETYYNCTGGTGAGDPSVCVRSYTCGDGVPEAGEGCDDGNVLGGDGCDANCQIEFCGDGIVNNGEECDDYLNDASGLPVSGDGCSDVCTIEAGWTCAASTSYGLPEPSDCDEVCGDGVQTTNEECDDMNTADNDGCDAKCRLETCGDGWAQTTGLGETCDDGNTISGDGCDDTCQEEVGWLCDQDGAAGCIPETACDLTAVFLEYKGSVSSYYGSYPCPFNPTVDANLDGVLDCADGQMIMSYKNLPAFDIDIGGQIAFDTFQYGPSPTPIQATIEFAVAATNGSTTHQPDASGFTTVVNAGTASGLGDNSLRNMDLAFDVTAPFSFPGGGLVVRITPISGTLPLTRLYYTWDSHFVGYMKMDYDGVYPWDQAENSYYYHAFPIKITQGTDACRDAGFPQGWMSGGNCVDDGTGDPNVGVCGRRHMAWRQDIERCGSAQENCHTKDYWNWNYTYSPSGTNFHRYYYLYHYYRTCSSCTISTNNASCSCSSANVKTVTQYRESSLDGDICTSPTSYSTTGFTYAATGNVTCYDGDPSTRNVGACSDGIDYCRNPTDVCIHETFPTPELCDNIDNDCNGVIDDPAAMAIVCDDGDPNTADTCVAGVCQSAQLCAGLDTECGTTAPCVNCLALNGRYPVDGAPTYACCDGNGDSCTCSEMEDRTYFCAAAGAPATGSVTLIDPTAINDGDTLTLDDGTNPAVVFEFDDNGATSGGNISVGISGLGTAEGVAAELAAVMNPLIQLDLVGTTGGTAIVSITHENSTASGNVTTWTSSNAAILAGITQPTGGEDIGASACTYTSVPSGFDINPGTCATCDDANVCTNDSCNVATGLCENAANSNANACYTADPLTENVGVCRTGTEVCTGGTLGACSDITPTAEVCDAFDNDCNDIVDDGTANDSCNAGRECFWGSCFKTCSNSGQCGMGNICYFPEGRCGDPTGLGGCSTDGDCAAGQVCVNGDCADVSDGSCANITCPGGHLCFNGACFPGPCSSDSDCEGGQGLRCYDSERCVKEDQQCKNVQCPEGLECVKGNCSEPCGTTVDCSGASSGDTCYGGHCKPKGNPCNGVDCAVDQVCHQGECYDACNVNTDCRDPGDVCWDATRCAPPLDPCEGVLCENGVEICYQGTCYLDCSMGDPCAQGGCYDATRCALDNCDGVQCAQGEVCHGGLCYEDCSSVDPCSDPSHQCYNGICTSDPCLDVQCLSGETCHLGVCYETCSDVDPCSDPASSCYQGICTDDPCANVLCLLSEVCWGGACYEDCSGTLTCSDPTHVCYDGFRCAPSDDPCLDVLCPLGDVCYGGACYPDCSDSATCETIDPNDACFNVPDGRCADDACQFVQCPVNESCYLGTCYPYCDGSTPCLDPSHICYDNRCTTGPCDGVQCPLGESCYEGVCYQVCDGTIDCSDPSHVCYDNRCIDPCDTVTCGSGELCYLGTCYEECGDGDPCSDPSHVCYNNRCVAADDPWCDGVMCPTGESCYRGTCYETCGAGDPCDDPTHICYKDVCLPPDCSATDCDTGEFCYNGVCFEYCDPDNPVCSDPSHACYDGRCSTSACTAMAQDYIDDYDDDHLFHDLEKRLHGRQYSSPWVWPRPFYEKDTKFKDWVDLSNGANRSSGNTSLYERSTARVVIYYDKDDSKSYFFWLITGSPDPGQGPTEATYSVRARGWDPDVELTDDKDLEAYRVSPQDGSWTHVQAHVTTDAGETGGVAIGKAPADQGGWAVEIDANFAGDIERWELINGETGEVQSTLAMSDTLTISSVTLPESVEIQPDYGTACDTGAPGICNQGTVTECTNHSLVCDRTVQPWSFEVCDFVDNTCNGLVDANDDSLKFAMASSKQTDELYWRAWPTLDSTTPVNPFMRYRPHDLTEDRSGNTDVKKPDGTSLQDPETLYVLMHRNIRTDEFSMPVLAGARSTDDSTISNFGDERVILNIYPPPGHNVTEQFVCWYDDRRPGPTGDRIPRTWTSGEVTFRPETEIIDGEIESDSIVIRPKWDEAKDGTVPYFWFDYDIAWDASNRYRWRRYAPRLSELRLRSYRYLEVKIEGTDPADALCVSDTPSASGCRLGTYICTANGVECAPAIDDNCDGCLDFDGDGYYGFDPAGCPLGQDCDDFDAETVPGGVEVCDGRDNDCDGRIDIQSGDCTTSFAMDVDGDGLLDCGPADCNESFACTCPDGPEELDDPANKCFCADNLSP